MFPAEKDRDFHALRGFTPRKAYFARPAGREPFPSKNLFFDGLQKAVDKVYSLYPAIAVQTRLEPARIGRWVASPWLRCFQHPERGSGRPAIPHGRWASLIKDVGLKGFVTNRAGNVIREPYSSSSSSSKRPKLAALQNIKN